MKPEDYIGKIVVTRSFFSSDGEFIQRIVNVETLNVSGPVVSAQGSGVYRFSTREEPCCYSELLLCNILDEGKIGTEEELFDSKEDLLKAYPDDIMVIKFLTEVI